MLEFITLLVVFQLKHFVADYLLQTRYMLGKFREKGWVKPLAAHCGIHMAMTFGIFLCVTSFKVAIALAVVDFVLHFMMDRVKASPNLGGQFNNTQPAYWYMLGFDQMFHHLTHYALILVAIFN